jgi:hypothetical protein
MDEKTKVIPTNVNPQSNAAQRPATPASQQPINRPPVSPVNAQNSLLKPGQPGTVQKKRIITGVLAAGGLLGGAFLLSGLRNPDEPVSGEVGKLAGAASTASDGPTVSTSKMVSVTTDHPVSDVLVDDLPFDDARDVARAEVGGLAIFSHQGRLHSTATDEEITSLTPDERAQYLQGIVTHEISGTNVDVTGREMEVNVAGMETFGRMMEHKDGSVYWQDMDGNGIDFENVRKEVIVDQETGEPLINSATGKELFQYVRTDPDTGERTLFSPSAILQNVDQGRIDVSIYPSNVEIADDGQVVVPNSNTPVEPIDTGTYLAGNGYAGWDTDGDGIIDNYDYDNNDYVQREGTYDPSLEDDIQPAEVDTRTNREIAMEKAQEMAAERGIDVNKIKLHETDDGGFDYKIKGDGGKQTGHFSPDELKHENENAPDTPINDATDTDPENVEFRNTLANPSTTNSNPADVPHQPEENDQPDDEPIYESTESDQSKNYRANNAAKPYQPEENDQTDDDPMYEPLPIDETKVKKRKKFTNQNSLRSGIGCKHIFFFI